MLVHLEQTERFQQSIVEKNINGAPTEIGRRWPEAQTYRGRDQCVREKALLKIASSETRRNFSCSLQVHALLCQLERSPASIDYALCHIPKRYDVVMRCRQHVFSSLSCTGGANTYSARCAILLAEATGCCHLPRPFFLQSANAAAATPAHVA